MPFSDLLLSEPLLKAVTDAGYTEPTAIQAAAIPKILMGNDLVGIAQTGTGKTASFVLPMIDVLSQGRARARMPRSLILEPTRELAAQVADNFEKYGKYHKLSMALLIGGVAFGDQDKALEKGVDVLIATPGRLLDQHERGRILMSGVEILVIDEADRMLDMGFIPDVERICTLIRADRQTLLFSATMPPPIEKLARQFMRDPRRVEVSRPATANTDIDQKLITVDSAPHAKRAALRALLADGSVQKMMAVCNRKTTVRELCQSLKRHGFAAGQIHGDMEQADRIRELERFRAGEIAILVASDVAARGLDIKGVSHVFNFDVPWHPDDYVHRIGRTGRAGKSGTAITLATSEDAEAIAAIEKLTGIAIPRLGPLPGEPAPARKPREPREPRGRDRPAKAREPDERQSRPKARKTPAPARHDAPPAQRQTAQQDRQRRRDASGGDEREPPSGPGFGDSGPPAFLSVSARR
ncbi:MAG: DEAD/DEAH box helicase [Sphingomonadaceae bacterium]